jgi:hypothetical protein
MSIRMSFLKGKRVLLLIDMLLPPGLFLLPSRKKLVLPRLWIRCVNLGVLGGIVVFTVIYRRYFLVR